MRSAHSKKPSVLIPSIIASKLPDAILLQAGNRSLTIQAQIDPQASSDSTRLRRVPPGVWRALNSPAY